MASGEENLPLDEAEGMKSKPSSDLGAQGEPPHFMRPPFSHMSPPSSTRIANAASDHPTVAKPRPPWATLDRR